MRHSNSGRKLTRTPAHRKALLHNLAKALLIHGKICTTEIKAKELRRVVEPLITLAKRNDLHARRQAYRVLNDHALVKRLFDEIGPVFAGVPGGYTRILKLAMPRKGDNAPMAVIELVREKTVVSEADRARRAAAAQAKAAEAEAPAEEAAPAEEQAAPAAEGEEVEVPINIEENAKVKAAVDYLKEVIALMGVENVTFSAVQKGEATIIRLDGEKLGALIGRRGETMESLSYLASLVANRLEGDYIKLGLDVAGYRDKRESDLTALAQRIGAKVRKTGRSFAMEPMNPYERRIIHSAIGKMEGVRSESKGEGRDRRVVIYSTAPDAQTENTYGERRGRGGNRNGRRPGGSRNGGYRGGNRSEHGDHNGNRGGYRGSRNGAPRGPRPSGVPERTYAPRDAENAAPVAPKRTERVDDFADFSFGKIEL